MERTGCTGSYMHVCTFTVYWTQTYIQLYMARVSFETSFDSKQPKLEPKLVSALSETKRLFRLFRFCTETASFDVSIKPKQTEDQPKQTETNRNESKNRFSRRSQSDIITFFCLLLFEATFALFFKDKKSYRNH